MTEPHPLLGCFAASSFRVFDGSRLFLYLDGLVVDFVDMSPGAAVDAPILLGDADRWSNYIGRIDEVAVYDEALAAERIKAHFDAAQLSTPARQRAGDISCRGRDVAWRVPGGSLIRAGVDHFRV